jgi:hypothetical protein
MRVLESILYSNGEVIVVFDLRQPNFGLFIHFNLDILQWLHEVSLRGTDVYIH